MMQQLSGALAFKAAMSMIAGPRSEYAAASI